MDLGLDRLGDPCIAAAVVAALIASHPVGLGGVVVRSRRGPALDAWLCRLREMQGDRPWVRIPTCVTEDRLLGGLDLTATLAAGRRVAERGLLARADGGFVVLSMAERAEPEIVGALLMAMDRGEVMLERDGISARDPARFALIAIDESEADEPGAPEALLDRVALHLTLPARLDGPLPRLGTGGLRRAALPRPESSPEAASALCRAAAAFGIVSLRGAILAQRAAQGLAALEGCAAVEERHVVAAARLVLAPRAVHLPPDEATEPMPPPPADSAADPPPDRENRELDEPDRADEREGHLGGELAEQLIESIRPHLPPRILAGDGAEGRKSRHSGRQGREQWATRGRRIGSRRGDPRRPPGIDVLATVRNAAPWQPARSGAWTAGERLEIRADDLRVKKVRRKTGTTVVFAVDASGSAAAGRLGEAKGAAELILAEGYARRDRVALIAFRGRRADLLLPPTRSLARAKRLLAFLPAGGPTPLAHGIDAAFEAAARAEHEGSRPCIVLLTDGRANVARDGSTGRASAEPDALQAASRIRATGWASLVIDTAARPSRLAKDLSEAMGGRLMVMPAGGGQGMRQVAAEVGRMQRVER